MTGLTNVDWYEIRGLIERKKNRTNDLKQQQKSQGLWTTPDVDDFSDRQCNDTTHNCRKGLDSGKKWVLSKIGCDILCPCCVGRFHQVIEERKDIDPGTVRLIFFL